MRLKTFTASTMVDAMEQVRTSLGPDAIIVSTFGGGRGKKVQVTAALDGPSDQKVISHFEGDKSNHAEDQMQDLFEYHRIPERIIRRLGQLREAESPASNVIALAGAIEKIFSFSPLPQKASRPIILIGAPGVGKTVTAAKLLARARLAGYHVAAISTDTIRTGGVGQLSGFIKVLGCPLHTSDSPDDFKDKLAQCANAELIVVDTPGSNPFDSEDMKQLSKFVNVAEVEPVLVMSAGGEIEEAREIGAAFRNIQANRLVVTQLDIARRYGSVLTAAEGGNLCLSEFSVGPYIAESLYGIDPVLIAKLLLIRNGDGAADIFLNQGISG